MDSKKTYSGLIGHPQQSEINQFIIEAKFQSLSPRKISEQIKTRFGFKVSHVTLASYYKEILNGGILDNLRDKIKEKIESGGTGSGQTKVSPERIEAIEGELSDQWSTENPVTKLYAKAFALCEANLSNHIEGLERLKIEYVKYLGDLQKILKAH
jgi:hypothetical protein